MVRPSASTDALIERVRRQVGAAGPHHGAGFAINADLCEPLWAAGTLEHWSPHPVEYINLAAQAVGEGQLKDSVADDHGNFGACGAKRRMPSQIAVHS